MLTKDNKWGREEMWETQFQMAKEDLIDPATGRRTSRPVLTQEKCDDLTNGTFRLGKNAMTEAELLFTFFHFYTRIFDWKTEA